MGLSSRRNSPSLAAFLSFVWPGLGQLYQRQHRAALVFAVPAVIVLLWAVLQLIHGPVWFALAMLGSDYALTIALLAVLVGIWRGLSILHAFVASVGRHSPSRTERGILAILLVAVLAVHGVVAANALAVFNFDRQIASNDFPQTSPDPQADSSGFPSEVPGMTSIPYDVEPGNTPDPSSHRITVLLTGVDFQTGRSHALNDTLLVVSLDTETGQSAMISVPRDTTGYPLYWGGTGQVKINAFQTYIRNHWIKAPDLPMTALEKEIGFLVGIPVNYYAQIDMDGFKELINLVGGVDVVNPKPLADPYYGNWHQPAGPIHLDGKNALIYVRSRHSAGDNDYGRSSRQQDVLIALAKKLASPAMALKLQQVLGLAGGAIQTNFPMGTMKDYLSFLEDFTSAAVSRCVLGPPYSWHPDSSTTGGAWTSQLKLDKVANLSVQLFGTESRYYGQKGVVPAPCAS